MRLIDAEKLKPIQVYRGDVFCEMVFMGDIENAPTVDAVPVVRCKECESWGLNVIKKDEKGEVIYGDCLHFCLATPKWFYCAWGERREDVRSGDR